MGELDEQYFKYTEPFDINEIVINKKPKYVYYEEYKKKNPEMRPHYAIVPQLLYAIYKPEVFDTLFRRQNNWFFYNFGMYRLWIKTKLIFILLFWKDEMPVKTIIYNRDI